MLLNCGQNIVLHHIESSAAACCSLCAKYVPPSASLLTKDHGGVPIGGCTAWAWNNVSHFCTLKWHELHTHTTAGTTGGLLVSPTPYKPPHPTPADAKNMLFIAVDDMRPNIGAYNYSLAYTASTTPFCSSRRSMSNCSNRNC